MAHHSSAIEGNTLTQGETKSILIDGYIPRAMDMRELHEVLNYKTFMPFLEDALEKGRRLSPGFIREVHAILCKDAIESVPGEFKKRPNMIIGAAFTPTPPYLVPTALEDWARNLEAQLASATGERDRVEAICRQHIAFEHIPPFPDGNGRVGRALMVIFCLQADMLPIVIPVEERKRYISLLNDDNVPGLVDFSEELLQEERTRYEAFA